MFVTDTHTHTFLKDEKAAPYAMILNDMEDTLLYDKQG